MQLANHYGDLVSANWWMDRCMHFTERVLAEPNRPGESFTLLLGITCWGAYSILAGREVRLVLYRFVCCVCTSSS